MNTAYPEQTELNDRTKRAITLYHEVVAGAQENNWRIIFLSGFAIDAHIGFVTRDHKDLDLIISKEQAPELSKYLTSLGHTVYATRTEGECLKVDQAIPDRPSQAHCDIHIVYEEEGKIVIPLNGKKLRLTAGWSEVAEELEFLGEHAQFLKPEYLIEEKIGWCEQIGLSRCRTNPVEYAAELEKIRSLVKPGGAKINP